MPAIAWVKFNRHSYRGDGVSGSVVGDVVAWLTRVGGIWQATLRFGQEYISSLHPVVLGECSSLSDARVAVEGAYAFNCIEEAREAREAMRKLDDMRQA